MEGGVPPLNPRGTSGRLAAHATVFGRGAPVVPQAGEHRARNGIRVRQGHRVHAWPRPGGGAPVDAFGGDTEGEHTGMSVPAGVTNW